MAICAHQTRPRHRPDTRDRPEGRATIREVCLVGGHHETTDWRRGNRVAWKGRRYRVASLQEPVTPQSAARRYAHLVPALG